MSQLSPGLVTASQGFAPSHNKSLLVFLALVLTCETPSEDWTGRGCGEQPLVTRSQEKAATLTYNQTLIPGSDWSDWARGGLSLVSSRTWKSVTDQTCRQLVTITNINSQFHFHGLRNENKFILLVFFVFQAMIVLKDFRTRKENHFIVFLLTN